MPMSPRLLRPVAASGFDPRTIAGLEMYLNAKVASSLTLNGSNVSEWRDLSGKGRHASQDTGANQPAYSATSWSGRPSVNFTRASSHRLLFTPFALTTQTAFFVIEPTAAVIENTAPVIFHCTTGTAGQNNRMAFLNISGYKTYSAILGAEVTGVPSSVGADIFAQAKMLISHTYNGSGSTTVGNHSLRKDKAAVTVQSSGTFNAGRGTPGDGLIGARRSNAGVFDEHISARYAMILLYNRVLSAAEIAAVENWAVSEYPLT
jgi:hypothetical protein